MASGATLEKLRQLYSRAEAEVKRWASLQEQALSLLGTIANVLSRLPALEDARAYGALAGLPGHPQLKERLLAKQLSALDGLILQLQGCLGDMQVAVNGMERQAQQAQRFVRQDRSLMPAVCAVVAGPVPSINQCLEGLDAIWRMHADELRLKYALAQEVRYDTSDGEMQQVRALFAAQPHIDSSRVADLLYVVAATAEPRRL
ncbi:hypothetical protein C2E21_8234 [Chlorella sorokiniana]|uniref:Uncharacterized protein n=1 Tax=Chlorella sorokiniana TaxID=3076 RepID=A0A2P6TFA0_CHLSO|nr:hypothetical protein C2E21_8234 [Chlorella sorokiniana]|eukprot:PRW32645.1 hypothetical protein C2E21_8234 [Chlorella sorokiniana]